MKIALAMRGLVRGPAFTENTFMKEYAASDVDWCSENLNILKDTFKSKGHEIETFLFSWTEQNTIEFVHKNKIDNLVLHKQPTLEDARKIVPAYPSDYGAGCNKIALYGVYMGWKTFFDTLNNSKQTYDYICFCRPDVRIRITDIDPWLSDCCIGPDVETYPINDQFYIAPYEQLIKMADLSIEAYNHGLSQSRNNEAAFMLFLNQRGISHRALSNFTDYNLKGIKKR
jgi:hypothetical protein